MPALCFHGYLEPVAKLTKAHACAVVTRPQVKSSSKLVNRSLWSWNSSSR
jgi:hypothetical protein